MREVKESILKAKSIAIFSHINPDGDSIGSLLALGLSLKRLGKDVYMISPDGIPKKYRSLPGIQSIIKRINERFDLAIAVDCSVKEMLGSALKIFEKAKTTIEIDHHAFRRSFSDISFIDTKATAVGELVYKLLKALGVKITKEIAQNILTSIIVETNSFRLPNTRSFTFKVCSELLKTGLDFYKITDTVYWSKSKEELILSKIALDRCKFIKEKRIAWSILYQADFRNIKVNEEDADSVADEIRAIKDVRIAVLFREKDRRFLRVSLRSKGDINVASLAEQFDGGGHFDKAGCYIRNSKRSIKKFLSLVSDLI